MDSIALQVTRVINITAFLSLLTSDTKKSGERAMSCFDHPARQLEDHAIGWKSFSSKR
jgi:hypothetical protein